MEKRSLSAGKIVLISVMVYLVLFLAGKYNDRLLYHVSKMAFQQTEDLGKEYTREDYGILLRVEDSMVVLLNSDRQGVSYRMDENTEIDHVSGLKPGNEVMVYATAHEKEQEPYLAWRIEAHLTDEVQWPGGGLQLETGTLRGTGG